MADLFCSFMYFRSLANGHTLPLFLPPNRYYSSPLHSHNSRINTVKRSSPHLPLLFKPSPFTASASDIDVISVHEQSDGSFLFQFGDPSEVQKNAEMEVSKDVEEGIEGDDNNGFSVVKGDDETEVTEAIDSADFIISSSNAAIAVEGENDLSEKLLASDESVVKVVKGDDETKVTEAIDSTYLIVSSSNAAIAVEGESDLSEKILESDGSVVKGDDETKVTEAIDSTDLIVSSSNAAIAVEGESDLSDKILESGGSVVKFVKGGDDTEVTEAIDSADLIVSNSNAIIAVEGESELSEKLLESLDDDELPILVSNEEMGGISTLELGIEHIENVEGLNEEFEDSSPVGASISDESLSFEESHEEASNIISTSKEMESTSIPGVDAGEKTVNVEECVEQEDVGSLAVASILDQRSELVDEITTVPLSEKGSDDINSAYIDADQTGKVEECLNQKDEDSPEDESMLDQSSEVVDKISTAGLLDKKSNDNTSADQTGKLVGVLNEDYEDSPVDDTLLDESPEVVNGISVVALLEKESDDITAISDSDIEATGNVEEGISEEYEDSPVDTPVLDKTSEIVNSITTEASLQMETADITSAPDIERENTGNVELGPDKVHEEPSSVEQGLDEDHEEPSAVEQILDKVHDEPSLVEQGLAEVREEPSAVEQGDLDEVHEEPSAVEKVIDEVHEEPRAVEQGLDEVREEPSAVEQGLYEVHEEQSAVEQGDLDELQEEPSAVEQVLYKVHEEPSLVEQGLDEVREEPSAVEQGDLDEVHEEPSAVEQVIDEVREEPSAVEQGLDEVREEQSAVEQGDLDEVREEPSAVEQVLYEVHEEPSSVEQGLDEVLEEPSAVERVLDEVHKEPGAVEQGLDEVREEPSAVEQGVYEVREEQSAVEQGDLDEVHEEPSAVEQVLYEVHKSLVEQGLDEVREEPSAVEQGDLDEVHEKPSAVEKVLDEVHEEPSAVEQGLDEVPEEPSAVEQGLDEVREEPSAVEQGIDEVYEEPNAVEQGLDEYREEPSAVEQGLDEVYEEPSAVNASKPDDNITSRDFDKENADPIILVDLKTEPLDAVLETNAYQGSLESAVTTNLALSEHQNVETAVQDETIRNGEENLDDNLVSPSPQMELEPAISSYKETKEPNSQKLATEENRETELNIVKDLGEQTVIGIDNGSDIYDAEAESPTTGSVEQVSESRSGMPHETVGYISDDMIQLLTVSPQSEADSMLEKESGIQPMEDPKEDAASENETMGGDLVEASVHEVTAPESAESIITSQETLLTDFVLSSGATLLPHPSSKVSTGGEDACFVAGQTWLGVADGVSQWSLEGTIPGDYAHELINNCEKLISGCNGNSINNPIELLNLSVAQTHSAGSSTVLIAQFDGQALHIANIGDSGFIVLRHGTVYKRSSPMHHAFSLPVHIERGDNPSFLAQLYRIDLEEEDVIIVATDGLLDNLYDQEISLITLKSLADNKSLEEIAELLANKAQEVGSSASARSPFADEAQAAGFPGYTGGKLDDVAVIVSLVQRR